MLPRISCVPAESGRRSSPGDRSLVFQSGVALHVGPGSRMRCRRCQRMRVISGVSRPTTLPCMVNGATRVALGERAVDLNEMHHRDRCESRTAGRTMLAVTVRRGQMDCRTDDHSPVLACLQTVGETGKPCHPRLDQGQIWSRIQFRSLRGVGFCVGVTQFVGPYAWCGYAYHRTNEGRPNPGPYSWRPAIVPGLLRTHRATDGERSALGAPGSVVIAVLVASVALRHG